MRGRWRGWPAAGFSFLVSSFSWKPGREVLPPLAVLWNQEFSLYSLAKILGHNHLRVNYRC